MDLVGRHVKCSPLALAQMGRNRKPAAVPLLWPAGRCVMSRWVGAEGAIYSTLGKVALCRMIYCFGAYCPHETYASRGQTIYQPDHTPLFLMGSTTWVLVLCGLCCWQVTMLELSELPSSSVYSSALLPHLIPQPHIMYAFQQTRAHRCTACTPASMHCSRHPHTNAQPSHMWHTHQTCTPLYTFTGS